MKFGFVLHEYIQQIPFCVMCKRNRSFIIALEASDIALAAMTSSGFKYSLNSDSKSDREAEFDFFFILFSPFYAVSQQSAEMAETR